MRQLNLDHRPTLSTRLIDLIETYALHTLHHVQVQKNRTTAGGAVLDPTCT